MVFIKYVHVLKCMDIWYKNCFKPGLLHKQWSDYSYNLKLKVTYWTTAEIVTREKGIASLSENVECIERSSDEVYIWCISLQHIVIFFLVTQYYHYQPGVFENHLKWANWLAGSNPD